MITVLHQWNMMQSVKDPDSCEQKKDAYFQQAWEYEKKTSMCSKQ